MRILLRPRLDPSTRFAWIMVIEAIPVLGILAYLLFGEVRMNQAEVLRMADVRDRLTGLRLPSPDIVTDPPNFARPVIAANESVGAMPVLSGNRVALLEESDAAIDRLVEAIDAARDHVHILFYIWLPDKSGVKIEEAVIRASARGVSCRVIVDALGSRGLVRSDHWQRMKRSGVECVKAFPLGVPLISMLFRRLDLRNHRKILIVDNNVAFTGSRNCADMAFATKPRFAPWVDVLFRVEGPVVRQLQSVFLGDWMSYTGEDLGRMLQPVGAVESPGCAAQVVATGPDLRAGSVADCLTGMLYAARERVVITTPYYVPDASLDAAVRAAARRGVDVTMILPARNDSLVVSAASQGFYYGLLAAGVRLHLFRDGLLHSKIMTVDGRMAMIGSANLDRRSFDLNYEVNMALFDDRLVAEIDERQDSYLARSDQISLQDVRNWGAWRRLRNNLLALASPLL
ncbi:cardiolipin synthase [Paracoccus sp. Z330]|uniref:Cardiolipin synthase n=1 Tax=Paracoccus onchidii TaxID=3017813 RepID=A0ABT4ZEI7_9RHOB|nr:cardiolipin synthase [Paracoccus onchidii]MDB6177772.1 cardiolipin synthase [Paracoccus onchidii]